MIALVTAFLVCILIVSLVAVVMYSLLREPAESSTSTVRREIDNLLSRIQQLEAITNGKQGKTLSHCCWHHTFPRYSQHAEVNKAQLWYRATFIKICNDYNNISSSSEI